MRREARDRAMTRHAEIAGGGIAGLSMATMLAKAGWSVRVHERSPEIRETGAGIYMRNNSLSILERLGIMTALAPLGTQVFKTRFVDRRGRLRQEFDLKGPGRTFVFPRQALVDVLADAARAAGVEIALAAPAAAAEPEGVLVMEDGRRLKADLVVAADGFRSQLRDRLVEGASHWELKTTVNRHFIPNRRITPDPVATQHWSGHRRIGVSPAGPAHSYVYSICPTSDARGRVLPLDLADWGNAFPALRPELEIIAAAPVTQYSYIMVRCPRWHQGRVAIIGDAAHGLPPTLGQGAGLSIMNALAAVIALDRRGSVEESLALWEREVRFISDMTQTWSCRYDWFTRGWPIALGFLRPAIFWCFRHFRVLNDRMRTADRGLELTALKP
jgi:2-polyprenyl-6-methoxyphenol hydroxylase-like FAD-dependent oxidoreductase